MHTYIHVHNITMTLINRHLITIIIYNNLKNYFKNFILFIAINHYYEYTYIKSLLIAVEHLTQETAYSKHIT